MRSVEFRSAYTDFSCLALSRVMTVSDIQREIERLPALLTVAPNANSSGEESAPAAPTLSPLQVAAKQGRLLLRLSAASEATEARLRDLAHQAQERDASLREAQEAAKAARDEAKREREARRDAEAETRKLALETIRFMDALEAARDAAASATPQTDFARELGIALQNGARRLAAAGITEVPTAGLMDGRLHSGVDTVPRHASETPGDENREDNENTRETPQYHIVGVVRRGWQRGPDILRRADVVTTE